jgi:hypothetical protein
VWYHFNAPAPLPPPPPGTHWIRGWVEPRARLDDVEKRKFLTLLGLEFRPLGRPARSQSLYRLRYPGQIQYKLMLLRHYHLNLYEAETFVNKCVGTINDCHILVNSLYFAFRHNCTLCFTYRP